MSAAWRALRALGTFPSRKPRGSGERGPSAAPPGRPRPPAQLLLCERDEPSLRAPAEAAAPCRPQHAPARPSGLRDVRLRARRVPRGAGPGATEAWGRSPLAQQLHEPGRPSRSLPAASARAGRTSGTTPSARKGARVRAQLAVTWARAPAAGGKLRGCGAGLDPRSSPQALLCRPFLLALGTVS